MRIKKRIFQIFKIKKEHSPLWTVGVFKQTPRCHTVLFVVANYIIKKVVKSMTVKQNKKNKTWYARVSYKSEGKYKLLNRYGLTTKKEAQAWERKLQEQIESGIDVGTNPVFADYFLRWFQTYKEQKVAPATKVNYMSTHKKIKEYFKDAKLKKITRHNYQNFLNHYGETLARTTMQKSNKHIRACVQDAVQNGILQKDFTFKAELIGLESKSNDLKYLSEVDSKRLIYELKTGSDDTTLTRRMALLALATGMRFSEVVGLRYENLNFKESTLKITNAWDGDNNKFKDTKNKESIRTIKVEPSIMSELQSFVFRQKEKQLSRKIKNPHGLVFSQFDGTPPSNNAANKALKRACARAGVQLITFHALRHTHVSILLYRGMEITAIAKRVGHASSSTTSEVYAHVIKELEHKSDQLSDLAIYELFST